MGHVAGLNATQRGISYYGLIRQIEKELQKGSQLLPRLLPFGCA